ncbi:MAG TPA: hypothetical protein EYH07_17545 [Kiloniellaceae bacterium]|nr:hypothetical protein [Kiloniellaceae bacterium]HIP80248.1 hypothetical protein [Kiloniellaceae bacterium]
MKIKAVPWPDVVEHYREPVEDKGQDSFAPMLELARVIVKSPYAAGLVAYTSVWDLIIAQSEANFWYGPYLRIELDPWKTKRFTFTYSERLDSRDPWSRTAAADEGFDVLERFLLKRARWFRKPADA